MSSLLMAIIFASHDVTASGDRLAPKSKLSPQEKGLESQARVTLRLDITASTYWGGNQQDAIVDMELGADGAIYVVGTTWSTDFPTTENAVSRSLKGPMDMFLSKISASGNEILYSTYIGGDGTESGGNIAVDRFGNAYITGKSTSSNFPVTPNAFQQKKPTPVPETALTEDAVIAKINTLTGKPVYASWLGARTNIEGIFVDTGSDLYLTGTMYDEKYQGGGFVAKFDTSGKPIFSEILGAARFSDITVDAKGFIYLTGSGRAKLTGQSLQSIANEGPQIIVIKLTPDASQVVYSTVLGTGVGTAIVVDERGNAFITGEIGIWRTNNASLPLSTTPNAVKRSLDDQAYSGSAFLMKLNSKGSALIYSTLLGGTIGQSLAVTSAGSVFVAGEADGRGADLAWSVMNFQDIDRGSNRLPRGSAFLVKLNAAGSYLQYSGYLQNSKGVGSTAVAIALDPSGGIVLAGNAEGNGAPSSSNAIFAQNRSVGKFLPFDGFIAKASLPQSPAIEITPKELNFGQQKVGIESAPQALSLVNSGDAALSFSKVSVSGDYRIVSHCGDKLAPGASCVFDVRFLPSLAEPNLGRLVILDPTYIVGRGSNAVYELTVTLYGVGVAH